jgi:catechol 2,3-dioxygenase-like lactoylglutathione lyase family enzyme
MDETPLARVTGLDHVVLKVADPEASVAWYHRVLGLEPERLEEWRRGEAPFVSVRVDAHTVIDLLRGAPDGRNVDHMALVVQDVDLEALAASGQVDVVVPPMRVWGAQGWGTGLYIADPDGHTVELRVYPES